MSLLTAGARRRGGATTTTTTTGAEVIPYAMPTAEPYHAPNYAITPTMDDGTGSVVHPGVVDMGEEGWQGYRYWMAATGYWLENNRRENPHILASNNGYHWHIPDGLANPVYPAPVLPRFNSDTDIEFDAENNRLVMIYRESQADATQQTLIATSSDGVTWPATAAVLNWTRPGVSADQQVASPAIIRRGAGDWWLFGVNTVNNSIVYYRAADPLGAWTGPTSLGVPNLGVATSRVWHLDVLWDGAAFRCIGDLGPRYAGRPDGYRAGTIDADGTTQIWAGRNFMDLRTEGWDTTELYRATFTPHEDGTHFRVWYSADGVESWRAGLTQVPRSLWPNIGDNITYPTPPADPPSPLTPSEPWNPATFAQAVLDLGAEGYWKLDEKSGVRAFDYSGHGRHGVYVGTAGYAYTLNSIDGHTRFTGGSVMIPDSDAFTPGAAGLSVFAAINSTGAGSYQRIVAKHVQSNGEWGLYAQFTALAGGYHTETSGGSYYALTQSDSGSLPIGLLGGAWHGTAMTVGAKALGGEKPRMFINNGTAIPGDPGTIGTAGAPRNTTTPVYIGGGAIYGIRHVVVFMRQLTPAEVGTLMTLARAEGIIA